MITCKTCHNSLVFIPSMKKWASLSPPQEAFSCVTGGDHEPHTRPPLITLEKIIYANPTKEQT